MLMRIGQNAAASNMPITATSIFAASEDACGGTRDDAGALARSSSACVSIIVVILPSAVAAQVIVRQHRSKQRHAVFLQALISLHGAFPVGDAAAQHQNQ